MEGNHGRRGRGKKLTNVWSKRSDKRKKDACTGCLKAAEKKGHPPKCHDCDWNPTLQPENTDAMHLWLSVNTQWRAGGMGLVGLDYGELRRQARDMDIRLTPGLWAKIKRLEFFELERQEGHADGADSGD